MVKLVNKQKGNCGPRLMTLLKIFDISVEDGIATVSYLFWVAGGPCSGSFILWSAL